MSQKFRVLLHVMTVRREIGTEYVLAKLLEHMGCECYLAGNNTYASRITRLWNPHGVVFVTLSRTRLLHKCYPNAHQFFFSGEGGESYKGSPQKCLAEDKAMFDTISRVYLWGESDKKLILRRASELKEKSFLYGRESLLDEKSTIIGHPRLDLLRYASKEVNNDGRLRIGLVGQFNKLNSISGNSAVHKVFSGSSAEDVREQVSLLEAYENIIKTLDPDRYVISIRPYPLENVDQYLDAKWVKEEKLKVDQSLEFSVWLSNQDLIIGPTSSTLAQIAFAKRAFINLDILINCSSNTREYNICNQLLKHVERHCPKTYDELFHMIENYKEYYIDESGYNGIMNDLSDGQVNNSSNLWFMASDIVKTLKANHKNVSIGIPINILKKIHDWRFKEDPTDYGSFCFTRMEKQLEKELNPIVDNIIAEMSNA